MNVRISTTFAIVASESAAAMIAAVFVIRRMGNPGQAAALSLLSCCRSVPAAVFAPGLVTRC